MTNHHLIFILLAATVASAITPRTRPPPPAPSIQDLLKIHHQQQLNNIINALIGSGDFTSWADILSSTGPTMLPLSATLFIPSDKDLISLSLYSNDHSTFPYHIVPQRLTFAELHQLRPLSRLPTLLANKSILITNASLSNFTLDDSLLSHPDLYTTSNFAVHGIARILDYSVYGDSHKVEVVPPPPPPSTEAPPQLVVPEERELVRGHVHGSNAAGRCFGGCVYMVIGFAVFGLVMQWCGLAC